MDFRDGEQFVISFFIILTGRGRLLHMQYSQNARYFLPFLSISVKLTKPLLSNYAVRKGKKN